MENMSASDRVCFREFGDQVKTWVTMNEPWMVSIPGYGAGNFPPGSQGLGSLGDDVYTVTHNIIKAHARAYRVYHEEFAPTQNGECSWHHAPINTHTKASL